MILRNKRILFIEPKFFNYDKAIKKELIEQGADVDSISYYKDSVLFRATRYFPSIQGWLMNQYFLKQYRHLKSTKYDFIFAIRGGKLTPKTIQEIQAKSPNATSILYLWDSIVENPYVRKIIPLFQKIMSFDQKDCKKFGFNYLPLFYTKDFESKKQKTEKIFKYDIVFIGRDHSDRYDILKKLKKECERLDLKPHFFLYTSRLGFIKRKLLGILKGKKISRFEFEFTPISHAEISKIYARAKSVVDIELSIQSGLTMRTFELLASETKMITTNQNIKDLELYNPANIHIIDRESPKLDKQFFANDFIHDGRIRKYSLENWIKNIFVN
ncbi:hypothetical protein [Maribellus sediminis]|uniref:hypothetical protein n=1 Tax=Maribellus sediminis TaxID=2696285 RepID=UPI0014314B58|nr:hypothetical protein [Maribellus sediminis]